MISRKRMTFLVLLALTAYASYVSLARARARAAAAQEPMARCSIAAPKEWGQFRGASQFGLAFEDEQGTIRFVTQMPCGVGTAPVNLEVRREKAR